MKLSSISLIATALAAIAGSVSAAPTPIFEHVNSSHVDSHALQAQISSHATHDSLAAYEAARKMGTKGWNNVADIHADYARENYKNFQKQSQAERSCTYAQDGKCIYKEDTHHLGIETHEQSVKTITTISAVKKERHAKG